MTQLIESLRTATPIALGAYAPPARTGLVIVDEVNGFCTPGCGPLAPAAPSEPVRLMVERTDRLASAFSRDAKPIFAFMDTHEPGKLEPPYPPHCERGTGQEELVDELAWLKTDHHATLIEKDCINGFVGAIRPSHERGAHGQFHNRFTDWVGLHGLEAILCVGICTDICVMDFVLTALSARNHGLAPSLKDIVVLEPACATYDLPLEAARAIGLPDTAAHPQAEAHHMGLWMMAARGAILANELEGYAL